MRTPARALAATLLVAACTRPATSRREPLTVALATTPHFGLFHLALAKGFLAEEGLDVSLRSHPFGKPALEDVLTGRADVATCTEAPVVFAEVRGQHLSVLASIGSSTRSYAVLARRAAGVTRPADLAGKRIGVPLGTSAEFFADAILLRAGLDPTAAALADLEPGEMAAALAAGTVDAVAAWEPTVHTLQRRFGDQLATFHEEDLYSDTALLVGRRGFAASRPEAARRVLRALVRAERLLREEPEEARRAVLSRLTGDAEVLNDVIARFRYGVRLDQGLLVLLEDEARWMRRSGRAPGAGDASFLETLDPAPLLGVDPGAVGLLR